MAGHVEKLRIRLPLGWSVLLLGVLTLVTGLGWLYMGLVREIDDMVRSTVAQFMGTVPFFIGVGILTFRRCCEIDREAGEVVKWWGILWPWSRRVFALSLFDKVTLRQEPKTGGSQRKPRVETIYPVRIEGEKRLDLRVDLPVDKARTLATEMAQYLDLSLVSTVADKKEEAEAE